MGTSPGPVTQKIVAGRRHVVAGGPRTGFYGVLSIRLAISA